MFKVKLWDILCAVVGVGAVVSLVGSALSLIADGSVSDLLFTVGVVGIGGISGVIVYLLRKQVNRWVVVVAVLVGFIGLGFLPVFWSSIAADFGFPVYVLVAIIGRFYSRARKTSESN